MVLTLYEITFSKYVEKKKSPTNQYVYYIVEECFKCFAYNVIRTYLYNVLCIR